MWLIVLSYLVVVVADSSNRTISFDFVDIKRLVLAQIPSEQLPDFLFGKTLTIHCGDKTGASYPYFDFQSSYDYLGLCFIGSKCQPLLESVLKVNDIHGEYSDHANFSFFYMENPDPELATMQIGRCIFCRLHSVELRRLSATHKSHERIAMSWRMQCSDSDSMKRAYVLSMRACGLWVQRIVYELGFEPESELESMASAGPPLTPPKPFKESEEHPTYNETDKHKDIQEKRHRFYRYNKMSNDELTILFIAIGITLTVAMCFLFVFALRLYHMKIMMDDRHMENIESDSYLSPISFEMFANEVGKQISKESSGSTTEEKEEGSE